MIFQRETKDFIIVDVMRDGVPTVAGIELAILARGQRPEGNPTAWVPAEIRSGEAGVKVENLAPGLYKVWARVTAAADLPVFIVLDFEVA